MGDVTKEKLKKASSKSSYQQTAQQAVSQSTDQLKDNQSSAQVEQSQGKDVDWFNYFLRDPDLSLSTKFRSLFLDAEVKSEEEFIKQLEEEAKANQTEPMTLEELTKLEADIKEDLFRNKAVGEARDLMGADWHAAQGSDEAEKAKKLGGGDPYQMRQEALSLGMDEVLKKSEVIKQKRAKAIEIIEGKKPGNKTEAKKVRDAAEYLLAGINAGTAEAAWKSLGSETAKKALETLGIPIPWFTTCVTVPGPVAKAAGVDLKKWGPLDMFNKKKAERFKEMSDNKAWVPAELKIRPKKGDILIMVSYPTMKGEPQKGLDKATFQHVSVLYQPVTDIEPSSDYPQRTELWVTADGGKGNSHKGEDKTGLSHRRYDPEKQQFVRLPGTKTYEASEGGRYLLGFWDITKLPRVAEEEIKKKAPADVAAYLKPAQKKK